jgi:hypothetical protein
MKARDGRSPAATETTEIAGSGCAWEAKKALPSLQFHLFPVSNKPQRSPLSHMAMTMAVAAAVAVLCRVGLGRAVAALESISSFLRSFPSPGPFSTRPKFCLRLKIERPPIYPRRFPFSQCCVETSLDTSRR